MIKITSPKIRWGISALLALLILFGTYRSVFSLAAFLICCLMTFFCDRESTLLQFFFVMPMANIFRITPTTQSFFTILILLYVVLNFVLPRKATLFVVLFAAYVVVGELLGGAFNLFRTIKLVFNLLFLSSVLNSEVNIRHKEIFLSFITGNILASVFKLFDSDVFKISSYIELETMGNPNLDNVVIRFSGLYSDPNYYAVGMIISLCLLIVLFYREEIKSFGAILFAVPVVYFLIQTYSKSAIIMVVVAVGFLVYSFHKKRNYFAVLLIVAATVIVIILAFSGRIPALQTVVDRFLASDTAEGMDVSGLTTGRADLWRIYLKHVITNMDVGLFGEGISSAQLISQPPHNTYLDVLYYLGAVGGSLLLLSLGAILEQSRLVALRRNFLNYSVLICITVMYFFLSELFYFDPPFQIFLAFTVLNLPLESHTKNELKEGQ